MNKQATWTSKRTPFEVIAALTDFARLSQQASALLAHAHGTSTTLGLSILTRLLSLCSADQGAFVLSFQAQGNGKQTLSAATLADQHAFPLVICSRMSIDLVTTALALFSPDGMDIQVPATMPHLLIWRRIIRTQPEEEGQASGRPLHAPLAYAYFLLHWSGTEHKTADLATISEQDLLPLMTDAVDAVLVNLVLARRVQDLEHLVHHNVERNNELLKAELLATVSHELLSPLASVKGYTTTLLRHDQQISPEERHEFLVAISSASTRLETIVNRLLEVSELETKTVPFEPTPVNLIHLVQEALTSARHFAGDEATPREETDRPLLTYTLHIEQEYDATLNDGLIIQGDRRLLRNLLDHLLENAMQYSPPNGKIEVGLRALVHQEALVTLEQQWHEVGPTVMVLPSTNHRSVPLMEIWVKDTGSGIAPEYLQHIFDRFYRVDRSLTREVNGLGLGLAICKSIVELHRGTIWVESEVGRGSTFHVLLPQQEHTAQTTKECI